PIVTAGLRDEALGDGADLAHRERGLTLGHGDAVPGEDLLGLILVDFHEKGRDPIIDLERMRAWKRALRAALCCANVALVAGLASPLGAVCGCHSGEAARPASPPPP